MKKLRFLLFTIIIATRTVFSPFQQAEKDFYFVMRIDKKEDVLNKYSEVKVIYEKNGYVFCKRTAVNNSNNDK